MSDYLPAALVLLVAAAAMYAPGLYNLLTPTPTVDDLLTEPSSDTPIFDTLAAERLRAELDAWGAQ